jgi:Ca2+/Na+ antiporter
MDQQATRPSAAQAMDNPYAAPKANVVPPENTDVETERKAYLQHETSVKSVGLLYMLGGVLAGGSMLITVISQLTASVRSGFVWLPLVLAVVLAGQVYVGYAVRKLHAWARVAGTVYSAIGLFVFPVGTLINGYILYLFWCKKGSRVFAPDYQDIIAQTPHIKRRVSWIVWLGVGLLLLGLLAFLVPALRR